MVVAVFRSLEGESLEGYSIRLAQAWRVGQKGLDNGVIFLVFLDDRKMRIEVGYGLEGSLTDAVSSSILRDVVAPRGSARGAPRTASRRASTPSTARSPAPTCARLPRVPNGAGSIWGARELAALFVVFVLICIFVQNHLQRVGVRRRGWTGSSSGWGGPMIGGGGFGGGSGGGSSGGGFSGGGGSFGGGGSSGSW